MSAIYFDVNKAADPTPKSDARGWSALGKDEFLKLLMAQMGSQDPTSPSDSEAFVAQLATFAQLELQQSANSNLENILMAQASANQTSMTNFVGKDVTYRTDRLTLERGQPAVAQVRLAGDGREDDRGDHRRQRQDGAHHPAAQARRRASWRSAGTAGTTSATRCSPAATRSG